MITIRQRIELARLAGWTLNWTDAGCHIAEPGERDSQWDALDGEPGDVTRLLDLWAVPEFKDHNDIQKVIDALDDEQLFDYTVELARITTNAPDDYHLMFKATAEQKADALLDLFNL